MPFRFHFRAFALIRFPSFLPSFACLPHHPILYHLFVAAVLCAMEKGKARASRSVYHSRSSRAGASGSAVRSGPRLPEPLSPRMDVSPLPPRSTEEQEVGDMTSSNSRPIIRPSLSTSSSSPSSHHTASPARARRTRRRSSSSSSSSTSGNGNETDDSRLPLPFSKREYLLAQIRQKDAIIESLLKQVRGSHSPASPYTSTY